MRIAEEALAVFQLIGDETKQPFPMRIMGYAAVHAGNFVRAKVLLHESLIGSTHLQNPREQLACLIGFAHCLLEEENFQEATMLCALANEHRDQTAFTFREPDNFMLETIMKQCQKKLGKAMYESMCEQGKAMNLTNTLGRLLE